MSFRLIGYIISTKCDVCFNISDSSTVAGILCRLDDIAEDRTPPGPGAVRNNVGRIGAEWSVVRVELARLVRRTVVVRVTDR